MKGQKLRAQCEINYCKKADHFVLRRFFSHPSKIDFIAQARSIGYEVILVFIHLDNVSLNQARVSQRVGEGGHDVPEEKIISRIPRVLKNIKQVIALCNQCYLLDNASLDEPFKQVATVRDGILVSKIAVLPEWARILLSDSTE